MSISEQQLKRRLKGLLRNPDNLCCADCGAKKPTWASINIGVFLCLNCAGIHRDLGVHISKVRSVDLDRWEEVWVDNMEHLGNAKVNSMYEKAPAAKINKPNEEDSQKLSLKMRKFIKDKYEKKAFYISDRPSQMTREPQAAHHVTASSLSVSNGKSKEMDLFSFMNNQKDIITGTQSSKEKFSKPKSKSLFHDIEAFTVSSTSHASGCADQITDNNATMNESNRLGDPYREKARAVLSLFKSSGDGHANIPKSDDVLKRSTGHLGKKDGSLNLEGIAHGELSANSTNSGLNKVEADPFASLFE